MSRLHARPTARQLEGLLAPGLPEDQLRPSLGLHHSFSLGPSPASSSFQMLSLGVGIRSVLPCNLYLRICCPGEQICSLLCQDGPQPPECRLHWHPHLREHASGSEQREKSHTGSPGGTRGKEPACQCRRRKRNEFDPWVRKILWRRAWLPTPVFWPGESQGQRSLVGYSPWGCKELDTTAAT